jgi:electron transfer flavoprotein beta subunit
VKILVCVKSVPEEESNFRINAAGNSYEEAGLKFKVNDYDLCAVEEAVRIKEKFKDVEITVLSVGPARVDAEIKKAMGLGCEHGMRIDEPEANSRDAIEIASSIAAWARNKNFDLILCGVMSEDLQRCSTGPMLAQLLGLSCATTVISLNFSDDRKKILSRRELEAGMREKVELPLPALLTIQTGINVPRYASLSNVLRVRNMKIPSVSASQLGGAGASGSVVRAYLPERSKTCEFFEGDPEDVAQQLIERIRERLHLL